MNRLNFWRNKISEYAPGTKEYTLAARIHAHLALQEQNRLYPVKYRLPKLKYYRAKKISVESQATEGLVKSAALTLVP